MVGWVGEGKGKGGREWGVGCEVWVVQRRKWPCCVVSGWVVECGGEWCVGEKKGSKEGMNK